MTLTKATYSMINGAPNNVLDYGAVGNGVTDDTVAIQACLDASWNSRKDVFIPGGTYLVTGLTLPGNYPTVDERDRAIRIYGQGYGVPFANANTGGTVLKSVTDAPIITDRPSTAPNAQGTYEIDHLRFDGTSTTPVVEFNGLYGTSSFHNNVIYQRGIGDGLKVIYGATAHIYENYSFNKDFATFSLGVARTGAGFNLPNSYGSGLVTLSKNSSRGFRDGFIVGNGAGPAFSFKITECECSVVYNGVTLGTNAQKVVVSDNYIEGGDQGVGVTNLGSYNTIENNLIFVGFSTGIVDTSTTNVGSLIQGNVINVGAVVNSICIDISSSGATGGNGKNVVNNTLIYTAGTNGVNGVKISGTDPRINCIGNAFVPRAAWTGTNTIKINDTSSNGVYGLITKTNGNYEIPFLSNGAIALFDNSPALTQADVAALTLTIPDAGSYFICSATSAASVFIINSGVTSGRLVTFRTTTANMTFSNGAFMTLAGGAAFTGPGTITFLIERIGSQNYAYELSRTVF